MNEDVQMRTTQPCRNQTQTIFMDYATLTSHIRRLTSTKAGHVLASSGLESLGILGHWSNEIRMARSLM